MRKGVVLMSAFLTAFVLAMLAGVVAAYQGFAANLNSDPPSTQSAVVTNPSTQDPVSLPVATQTTMISPQDAAAIAAKFLNQKDPYSVEIVSFGGANTYKVTFRSGNILYVSLSGQIVSYVQAPTATPQVVVVQSYSSGHHSGGGGGGGGEGGGGSEPGDN